MNVFKQNRQQAGNEIVMVLGISALAFTGELLLADHLPWGEEARGVAAVLAGTAACLVLILMGGGKPADLGLRKPRSWWSFPIWVLGILVTFILAQNVLPLLIQPLFDLPEPDLSRYDAIRGNPVPALAFALILPLFAAIPEEVLYRGFLIERLQTVFAGIRGAPVLAVLVQALILGCIHFQWGIGGVVVTAIMGAIWGFAYLLCGRNLFIVITAHSVAHLALVAQLYSLPPV